ncbi:MAG: isoleucyl-tRNA synthetase, partial [Burkholderiales bacterium]
TSDFDPKKDAVPVQELFEIDRFAIARMDELQREIGQHLEGYEFHPVVAKLQMYCSEDLGGFYLDILKDRLYTAGATSKARRSAQTAIWHITNALLRVMAPMLSFTAEEAWAVFADKDTYAASDETIFTQTYYTLPEIAEAPALLARFAALRELRAEVTKRLEEVRIAGGIGSSLQAELEIKASGDKYALLKSLGDDLKFVFITSNATVTPVGSEAEEAVVVTPSTHQKCERCWHYRADVGAHPEHPGICGRCVSNLFGNGEARKFA